MKNEDQDDTAAVNDVFELTLIKPVSSGDVEYESITLVEPTAAQIDEFTKNIDKYGAISAQIKFIATNCKTPEGAIKKLRARDFKEAADYLSSFL